MKLGISWKRLEASRTIILLPLPQHENPKTIVTIARKPIMTSIASKIKKNSQDMDIRFRILSEARVGVC